MKLQRSILFGIAIISCLVVANENVFVKPKRQKKKSAARLKDEIGTQLADSLVASTKIVERIGALQGELMRMTAALIEQPAQSSLTKADRMALNERLNTLHAIRQELEALVQRLGHHTNNVHKLY